MTYEWNINIPELLISVTGGAKNFSSMPPQLTDFLKSLVKSAAKAGILLSVSA